MQRNWNCHSFNWYTAHSANATFKLFRTKTQLAPFGATNRKQNPAKHFKTDSIHHSTFFFSICLHWTHLRNLRMAPSDGVSLSLGPSRLSPSPIFTKIKTFNVEFCKPQRTALPFRHPISSRPWDTLSLFVTTVALVLLPPSFNQCLSTEPR